MISSSKLNQKYLILANSKISKLWLWIFILKYFQIKFKCFSKCYLQVVFEILIFMDDIVGFCRISELFCQWTVLFKRCHAQCHGILVQINNVYVLLFQMLQNDGSRRGGTFLFKFHIDRMIHTEFIHEKNGKFFWLIDPTDHKLITEPQATVFDVVAEIID